MYIYYLKGMVTEIDTNLVVIDCGGVGYECNTSNYTISQVRQGTEQKLYVYCSIREDALELFGFSSKEEKTCFEQLISVSGVGPKAALSILSVTTPGGFRSAIASGNEKALTAASGVGKKLAQRVLLELKDKIGFDSVLEEANSQSFSTGASNGNEREAAEALSSLGYSASEIANVLKKLDVKNMTVEEIVRSALRAMVMKL